MKKLLTILLIIATVFAINAQNKTRYVFVKDTEHDKAYDEEAKNGYVNIANNIVSVNYELNKNVIESLYVKHYEVEEQTQN